MLVLGMWVSKHRIQSRQNISILHQLLILMANCLLLMLNTTSITAMHHFFICNDMTKCNKRKTDSSPPLIFSPWWIIRVFLFLTVARDKLMNDVLSMVLALHHTIVLIQCSNETRTNTLQSLGWSMNMGRFGATMHVSIRTYIKAHRPDFTWNVLANLCFIAGWKQLGHLQWSSSHMWWL